MTTTLGHWLVRLYPKLASRRSAVASVLYVVVSAIALVIATFARVGFSSPEMARTTILWGLPVLLPLRALAFWVFKVQRSRWRFVGIHALGRLVSATATASLALFAVSLFLPVPFPRSIILIEWLLATNAIGCIWVTYRLAIEWSGAAAVQEELRPKRVLIVGAGEAGCRLLRELRRPGGHAFRIVGFVDDDRLKHGSVIDGVEVLGWVDDLPTLAQETETDEIIVALPSAAPEAMRRIVDYCEAADRPYRVLPAIDAVLKGHVSLDQLRDVRIEDLLGRDPIKLELPELEADLGGEVVLVTGAAGSIGSEICRQVALHGPARLLLLDQAESPLFFVEQELRRAHPDLEVVPIIGDILDETALDDVFSGHRPTRVFHAAAYKHVPMMEANVRQAILNNAMGTWRVAEAAANHGARKFVLISTDKAVNPTSVMGATKRVSELVILGFAERYPETFWTAVRFGNVLGSAGSVIPIFRKQLAAGQPITVTHEEVTRFFMTIPEAVQLVLQASVLPEAKGHIAMLDMGEPVRIMDLARALIRLSGRTEGVDAQIVISGLRPGEKLHEELSAPFEEPVPSSVPRVSVLLDGHSLPSPEALMIRLEAFWRQVRSGDEEVLREVLLSLARAKVHRTEVAATFPSAD